MKLIKNNLSSFAPIIFFLAFFFFLTASAAEAGYLMKPQPGVSGAYNDWMPQNAYRAMGKCPSDVSDHACAPSTECVTPSNTTDSSCAGYPFMDSYYNPSTGPQLSESGGVLQPYTPDSKSGSFPASGCYKTTIYACTDVPSAPVVNITASPSSITSGESSTLSWSVSGATSCSAYGAWGGSKNSNGGTQDVSPTSDSTYTLTCTNSVGSDSDSAQITVSAPSEPEPDPTYTCGGNLPTNASPHDPEEATNVTSPTSWTYSTYDYSNVKCQFGCDSGYSWNGSSCEPITYSCTGSIPSNAQAHDSEESSSLSSNQSWSYSENDTSTKCQFECYGGYEWDSSFNSCEPVQPPNSPNITATAGSCDSGEITVTWDSILNAEEYRIYSTTNNWVNTTYEGTVNPPSTSFTDTGLADNTTYTYMVEAENVSGSSESSPDSATTPYDCQTLDGVDLVADGIAVHEGDNTNAIDGTYDNYQIRMEVDNAGMGTLEVTDNVSYDAQLGYDSYWSRSTSTSNPGSFSGPLPRNLVRAFNNVPFGTHNNCSRINLDPDDSPGSFDEYPANYDNNKNCETIIIPVPEPPMDIWSDDDLVRPGQTTRIHWSANTSYPLECEVRGPAGITADFNTTDNGSSNPYADSQVTNAVNNTGQFILTCTEPHTDTVFEVDTTVEVVPGFEEI